MRATRTAAAALILALVACSGGNGTDDGDRIEVAAAFYPLEFLVERIGGDAVELTRLTKPGTEPHDVELSAQQVAAVADADVVVYLDGFQPAVDAAVADEAEDRGLDAAAAVETGDDPHVWLDPVAYSAIAETVADALASRSPQHRAAIEERAEALQAELATLDDELRAGLKTCERTEIVTSHAAFGHLATAYGLREVAISGLSPEDEPSPGRLAEIADYAREHGVTTIFFEELVSPRTAKALASEVGATTAVLSPIEGPPENGDYFTAMRANLAALRTALGCT